MTARARPGPRDRGQAVPLMAAMLLLAMGAVVVTIEIGRLLNESAAARTAADAAALAGAADGPDGPDGATAIAVANGAVLLSYEEEPADDSDALLVTVTVQVGRTSRTARAERQVEWAASEQEAERIGRDLPTKSAGVERGRGPSGP